MKRLNMLALATLAVATGASAGPVNLIVNGGFESSSVAPGGFQYAYVPGFSPVGVTAAGWRFGDSTGTGIINRDANSWGGAAASSAVAFLQDHPLFAGAAPALSQQFNSNGSSYLLSFDVGQRPGFNLQDVVVKLDGVTVASGLGAPSGGLVHYDFNIAGITGDLHTLLFTSAFNAGDSSAYVDNVSLVATAFQTATVPEPASLGLAGVALLALGTVRRRQAGR